jgi:hypothetical protein
MSDDTSRYPPTPAASKPSTLRVVLGAIPAIGPLLAPDRPAPLRARLLGAIPLMALAVLGFVIYAGTQRSESEGPSIIVTGADGPAKARPSSRHAGEQLVDSLMGGDAAKYLGGGLLLGRSPSGAWQGALGAEGYTLTGTQPTNSSVWHITPSFNDNGAQLPVAAIAADVFVASDDDDGAAGLELARSTTGSYIFAISRAGIVLMSTYAYRANGTEGLGGSRLTIAGAKVDDWNHIEIRRRDGVVQFLVNGDVAGTLSDSTIDGLDAGLFATGRGIFRFRKVVRTLG